MKSFISFTAVILAGVMFGMFFSLSIFKSNMRNNTNNYNIVKPTNGKAHPIIMIRKKGNLSGGCTAFVVSDNIAVTAGHCMDATQVNIAHKQEQIEQLHKDIAQVEKDMADVRITCDLNPMCAMELGTMQAILDGLKKTLEEYKKMEVDVFNVIDTEGNLYEDLEVISWDKSPNIRRRDWGELRGNFKNFNKLPVKIGWDVKRGDVLRACGFFGTVEPPFCNDFVAIGNHHFGYKGHGLFVPGISGGPVIDKNGYVVGIAVSAAESFVVLTPMIGIFNIRTGKNKHNNE